MFDSMLADFPQCAEALRQTTPMPGVKVCRFCGSLPAADWPEPAAGHHEALFCQDGSLSFCTGSGRSCCVRKGDVLLAADMAQLRTCSGGSFWGIVVAVDTACARESLARICALLGLALDVGQAGRLMRANEGCVLLHGSPWSEALFLALAELPAEEQERYCVLKTVELLYLLCSGGLAPSRTWLEHDGGQAELVRQASDFIQAHLAEDLSIDRLSRQFHCSPTALKLAFRQSCGMSIHRCITAYRMERSAQLLSTTTFSVLQIASEVGYCSTSQFSTMFKRQYHVTPAQYRRKCLKPSDNPSEAASIRRPGMI